MPRRQLSEHELLILGGAVDEPIPLITAVGYVQVLTRVGRRAALALAVDIIRRLTCEGMTTVWRNDGDPVRLSPVAAAALDVTLSEALPRFDRLSNRDEWMFWLYVDITPDGRAAAAEFGAEAVLDDHTREALRRLELTDS